MSESYNMRINEAIGKKSDILARKQAQQQGLTDDKRDQILRIGKIQGARENGTLDELYPEIFELIRKYFPKWEVVKDYAIVEQKPQTFYIDDQERITIHDNFDQDSVKKLFELCDKIAIHKIIGNIIINRSNYDIKGFPASFPKTLEGEINIRRAYRFEDFTNFPVNVLTVKVDPVNYTINGKSSYEAWKKRTTCQDIKDGKFGLTNTFKESVNEDDVHARFELGLKYLAEAKGVNYVGSILRPSGLRRNDLDRDSEEYGELNAIYQENREIFKDVVIPILPVDWGSIPKSAVTELKDRKAIYDQITSGIRKFYGINIYTSNDDKIGLIYAKPKADSRIHILGFRTPSGDFVTDQQEIAKEFKKRDKVFRTFRQTMEKVGITSDDFPHKTDKNSGNAKAPTVRSLLLSCLYFALANLNGTERQGKKYVDLILKREGSAAGQSVSGYTDDMLLSYILNGIFDGGVTNNGSGKFKVEWDNGEKYDERAFINLDTAGTSYNKNKMTFMSAAEDAIRYNGYDVVSIFNEDFLYNILIGISVRDSSNVSKIHDFDSVVDAYTSGNYSEIEDMVRDSIDVNIDETFMRNMQYGKGEKQETGNNPYDIVLLFPGIAEKGISIRIKVDEYAVVNLMKILNRKIQKVGMRDDIITGYDTDPVTGEKTPRKILGTASLGKEKGTEDLGIAGEFNEIAVASQKHAEDYPGLVKAVAAAAKESGTYDSKKFSQSFEDALKLINDYVGIFQRMVSEQFTEEDINTYDTELNAVVDIYYKFSDMLQDDLIPLVNEGGDYYKILDCADRIIDISNSIAEYYKKLKGIGDFDNKEVNAIKKKSGKRSMRRIAAPFEDDTLMDTLNKLERYYGVFYRSLDDVFDADEFYAEKARTGGDSYVKVTAKLDIRGTKTEIVNGISGAVDDAIDKGNKLATEGTSTGMDDKFMNLAKAVYDFINDAPEARGAEPADIEAAIRKAIEIYDIAAEINGTSVAGPAKVNPDVEKASSLFAGVIDAVKLIDFATADRRAVSTFSTKNGMITKIKDELTSAIAYGNAAASSGKLGKAFEDMFADLVEEMETLIGYATGDNPNINRAMSQAAKKIYDIAMDISTEAEDAGVVIGAAAASGAVSA